MAAFAGRDQRGAAIAVGTLQVGAVEQGQAQDFQAALGAGQQIRTVEPAVLPVDVGAGLDQLARHRQVVVGGGQQQRGAAVGAGRVDLDLRSSRLATCAVSPRRAASSNAPASLAPAPPLNAAQTSMAPLLHRLARDMSMGSDRRWRKYGVDVMYAEIK